MCEPSRRHSNHSGAEGHSPAIDLDYKKKLSLDSGRFGDIRILNDWKSQPDGNFLGAKLLLDYVCLPMPIQSFSHDSTKRLLSFAAYTEILDSRRSASSLLLPEFSFFVCPLCNQFRTHLRPPLQSALSESLCTSFREKPHPDERAIVFAAGSVPKQIISPAFAQREEVPTIVISVKSYKDLLLRTTINKYGKKIEFKAADNYKGFTGKIGVTFPPFSVLGEEKVFLEIVPESLVHAYNETSKKLKSGVPEIITPILHIDRESDTSFLRDVEVSFPVFPKFSKILDNCQSSDKLLVENGQILLRESKFSPKAVSYDPIESILRALRVDTNFSLAFRELGVYLLVEQFPKNEFLFDLRPFRDEEEHRLYRMDEKKTFRMIANPQDTDPTYYRSRVSIIVQKPAVVHNNQEAWNVEGNKINFIFPHLGFDIDDFNERKVTVVTEDQSLRSFGVKFEFKSNLLNEKGYDRVIEIPLHSEMELTKFSTRRFVQSEGMLLEFLKRLDSNWATFLAVYLGVEMRRMKEFIARDLRLSLPPCNLNWSEEIKRQLKMETDAREFQEVSCRKQLVETMLKNYQSSNDMFKAKAEIIEILKNAEVLASDTECPQGLRPESRDILASALMYVPVTKLRESMLAAFVRGKLFSPTPDVDKFIYDGDLPDGEGTGETLERN